LLRNVIVQVLIDAFEIDVSIVDANVINACSTFFAVLRQRAKNDAFLDEPLFEDQTVDVFGELEVGSRSLI
jgi:hypothetical protein